jgi:hypothetical protein
LEVAAGRSECEGRETITPSFRPDFARDWAERPTGATPDTLSA